MLDPITVLTLYCTAEAGIVIFAYYDRKKREANHTYQAGFSPLLVKEKQL